MFQLFENSFDVKNNIEIIRKLDLNFCEPKVCKMNYRIATERGGLLTVTCTVNG